MLLHMKINSTIMQMFNDLGKGTLGLAICLFVVFGGIGGGFLGGASSYPCGITLKSSRDQTSQRVGIVTGNATQQVNDNWAYYNVLALEPLPSNAEENSCSLQVCVGSNDICSKRLLPIGQVVVTNYESSNSRCFFAPQSRSCRTANALTIAGIVFSSVAGFVLISGMCLAGALS